MKKNIYEIKSKICTLIKADLENMPLIVFNSVSEDGEQILIEACKKTGLRINFLCVCNLNWHHDMSPWKCSSLSVNDTPFTGGADDYINVLTSEIIPKALQLVDGLPPYIGLAGYSLAGLFSLYAMYKCEVFDCIASMSGSLWFPGFEEYVLTHEPAKRPVKIYISLGNKEARTKNKVLKAVQKNTESIVQCYKEKEIDVIWELNKGNHFTDHIVRSAKGIVSIANIKQYQ